MRHSPAFHPIGGRAAPLASSTREPRNSWAPFGLAPELRELPSTSPPKIFPIELGGF